MKLILIFYVLIFSAQGQKNVQEINFDELQVEGKSINPEGFFLVQRPGIEFKPLIEIKSDLDRKIRRSHRRIQEGL